MSMKTKASRRRLRLGDGTRVDEFNDALIKLVSFNFVEDADKVCIILFNWYPKLVTIYSVVSWKFPNLTFIGFNWK